MSYFSWYPRCPIGALCDVGAPITPRACAPKIAYIISIRHKEHGVVYPADLIYIILYHIS